ncbi:5'/3'-nucleotidase SurE [Hydrogenovibrio sp. SC-1]|uniref:5'/3'-nucleotidase SurE n=1 Tax=Hydrogenovibrio sp. SC-1 TaxID=2065820 RepID=UPI000C7C29D0|nr:5'/3'-nucleotidase SurE [Hydrogenovibrio sp. SC-1]PLA73642.1 5'/3'-nucleotidase SurE [Hydrogenovibrio sp. SC-1]
MKILLSNDDGYDAQGIRALWDCLHQLNLHSELRLIAPDRNRSAASNSLTLMEPLRIQTHAEHIYSVNGTPTDCVHLGINGAMDFQPDMVISGINAGANMGDDVLYSGTVAAATEGRFLGKPSIAVSLCGDQYFDTATHVLLKLFKELDQLPFDKATILNINIPDCAYEDVQGIKITRLGSRHCSEKVVTSLDPRGKKIYWVGPAGQAQDASEGTDFHAVENGYVSITPLKVDLTHYEMQPLLANWVNGLS